jgi:DNA-binding response OmpR family regulator
VNEARANILIVEDDPDVAEMLHKYFHVQGYEVTTVNWGGDAAPACRSNRPDLIILDIRLPDIDGFEVARRLRSNRRTQDIPIIFLTERRNRGDRLQGLQLGADDYVTKPFDIHELRLRVQKTLRRLSEATLTNPVTNLPEGGLVKERLDECRKNSDCAMITVSLQHLDAFRDSYGFVAADDVLRAVSVMIRNAVQELGTPGDFLGQMGGNVLVVISNVNVMPSLVERIRTRLVQSLDYFYPEKDRDLNLRSGKRLDVSITQYSAGKDDLPDIDGNPHEKRRIND